jgi:hypothetical protein
MPHAYAETTPHGIGVAGVEGAISLMTLHDKQVDYETGKAEQVKDQQHRSDRRGIGLDAGREADDDPQRHGRAREDLRGVHFGRCGGEETHDVAAPVYAAIMCGTDRWSFGRFAELRPRRKRRASCCLWHRAASRFAVPLMQLRAAGQR